MENSLFQGSLISWIIGLPFIVLIILTNQDPRIKTLLINETKMTDGNELLSQLKYLTKLIVSHSIFKLCLFINLFNYFKIQIEMIQYC